MATETMTKHTPGPWTTNGYSIGIPAGTIAQMYRPGDQSGRGIIQSEQEANARLIAAAPELLEACKLLLMDLTTDAARQAIGRYYSPKVWEDRVAQARAAIAKATQ